MRRKPPSGIGGLECEHCEQVRELINLRQGIRDKNYWAWLRQCLLRACQEYVENEVAKVQFIGICMAGFTRAGSRIRQVSDRTDLSSMLSRPLGRYRHG